MAGAYTRVDAQFTTANSYANAAHSRAETFVNALQTIVNDLQPPTLDIDLEWPVAPVPGPDVTVDFDAPSVVFPTDDGATLPEVPDLTIVEATAPTAPTLTVGPFSHGIAPSKPIMEALAEVSPPDEPGDWTPPDAPQLLTLSIVPFAGVNMHSDWVDRLANIPSDLVLAAPSPYSYVAAPRYDSALLEAMRSELQRRIAGGTGLSPAVEAAIWDRARSRETATSNARIAEVMRNAEARGFALPSGALAAQLRDAQRELYAKQAELSRDIAIKQAELEQTNVKDAIAQGVALEAKLIDYANQIEQRTFEAARATADNAVQIYNSLVEAYKANLARYETYASVYKSLMDGERAAVEAYRAQVEAESTKAGINKTLIEQQRAQIDVRMAEIEVYKSRLVAMQTLLSVEKLKVETFATKIQGYVAEVNAESVRAEAYKAEVQGDAARVDAYRAQVEAYATEMRTRTDISRAKADTYDAEVRAYLARAQRYATLVNAIAEQARTSVAVEGLKLEKAKTDIGQNVSNNQLQLEQYRTQVSLYEANKAIAVERVKLLSSNYFAIQSIAADAAKVAAQVNAQLGASAYGTIGTHVNMNATDSVAQSFNFAGKTTGTSMPPTY